MYVTPLDKAIGHYLVDSGSNLRSVATFLGISDRGLVSKRRGERPFTARETRLLADLLGMTMDDLFALMPEQQH